MNAERRKPKSEIRTPKSEARIGGGLVCGIGLRISGFWFLPDFGFRISGL